ncbi:hypothetical protein C7U92_02320 [Bradyrhizobium sp. WBOS7]|uniref:Uncharacterized protein n=1 Tax=Bradyrhizobium betae TaxID=244734 RepID=A0AAE9SQ83_9BRAD|nr:MULTISPECIES: hypothetical protein [Bradyrhizobium]MDD1569471.1 hypothetical protein [Bradyrhizobium sp. WBOS1]UUO36021.1 hypothetical protein DCK84_16590 [Bradyrhizobium sp. WBOS01]MDD1526930.1 hypothetical protein [Bradyrhizobium sp. WBOS2]MDD1575570.1 hypothetical protein [Bradyrhizobium sp. WBOS7]MDD1604254.1 hypothetical protein [Bradyrhizobium sp. WBOS16]
MTEAQAFSAMFIFLEEAWKRTRSDGLAMILGGMSLLEDGTPADPAVVEDWKSAVARALSGESAGRLTFP